MCKFPGCETKSRLRGYCRSCFERLYREGKIQKTTPTEHPDEGEFLTRTERERFVKKLSIPECPDSCWNWTGCLWGKSKYTVGYGAVKIRRIRQTPLKANRVAMCLWNQGDIEDPRDVCHTCDNPLCCNPEHLFWGTRKENMQDCVNKGRSAAGERNGTAKLTEDQVIKIRGLASSYPATEIIKQLNLKVSPSAISNVIKDKSWKHVLR